MRVSRFKAIGYLADSQLRPIGWTVDERIAGAQSSEGAIKTVYYSFAHTEHESVLPCWALCLDQQKTSG